MQTSRKAVDLLRVRLILSSYNAVIRIDPHILDLAWLPLFCSILRDRSLLLVIPYSPSRTNSSAGRSTPSYCTHRPLCLLYTIWSPHAPSHAAHDRVIPPIGHNWWLSPPFTLSTSHSPPFDPNDCIPGYYFCLLRCFETQIGWDSEL